MISDRTSFSNTWLPRRWSLPEHTAMTDRLLMEIEQSPACKVALRFDKGTTASVNSQGKKASDHYEALATAVFLTGLSEWQEEHMPGLAPLDFSAVPFADLVKSIKSRVSRYVAHVFMMVYCLSVLYFRLKTQYTMYRNKLGETGQGLVDEGCEGEFTKGSKLGNLWGMLCHSYLILFYAHA